MDRDEEIIELCKEVFKSMGIKRMVSRLEDYLEFPDAIHINNLYDEALKWQSVEENVKKRNFVFGNNYSLLKCFIISIGKGYDQEGRPRIEINKLEDETASFKDNPIKNLFIVYDEEDDRDIDFERLLIMR